MVMTLLLVPVPFPMVMALLLGVRGRAGRNSCVNSCANPALGRQRYSAPADATVMKQGSY